MFTIALWAYHKFGEMGVLDSEAPYKEILDVVVEKYACQRAATPYFHLDDVFGF